MCLIISAQYHRCTEVAFMDLLNRFDRHPLIFRPTPLHSLPRFSEYLGGVEVWA